MCACVQVRTFAAEATPEPTVDVPLKLFSLPGKYATALYTTAAKEGNLKKVETDLKSVRTTEHIHTYIHTYIHKTHEENNETLQYIQSRACARGEERLFAVGMGDEMSLGPD